MAAIAFGRGTTRNKTEGTITLPAGGIITFTNIADEISYGKLQGRSFTGMFGDEVGNYPPQSFKFMQLVRSNLRVPTGRRVAIHWTANPHGRSHSVLFKNWISKAPPWHPWQDDAGDWWVWTTSSLDDNPHIDREAYRRQLKAAVGADTALADAWIKGDWSVLGGCMFDLFDPAVHIVPPPNAGRGTFAYVTGADWGTAAPATALLIGQLRASFARMPYGSFVVLDETDTADPADLSLGMSAPVQMFCEMVQEMHARNACDPEVVIDDARGLQSETVVELFRQAGLDANKPYKKDRIGQWNLIRQLLANAVSGDGPGLYFAAGRCPHLLETLPEAPRGTLRAEDIDPKWNRDHWLDALAYGVRDRWEYPKSGAGKTTGYY